MRIGIGIEYDGTGFYGWQKQANVPTIQGELEKALGQVANSVIELTVAGRTDAGVHALEQVAHFDTEIVRPFQAWVFGTNVYLPSGIKVLWAKKVDDDFHARFSARSRTYRYLILNRKIPPALMHNQAMWCRAKLDINLMQEGANFLLGEHDFTSFRGSGCQSRSPNRYVESITILSETEHLVAVEITANAFLLHMVRNIIGVLLEIGTKVHPPQWAEQVLKARDRRIAGITAPPQGLYLVGIDYTNRSSSVISTP